MLKRRTFLQTLAAAGPGRAAESAAPSPRPNVLFLAVDDMRDWSAGLRGYQGVVHTPSQDRLARGGVLFTNAHCASPVCNPSRTAIMLGRHPFKTGIYGNGQWWKPVFPDALTIPLNFRENGYHVAGGGKLFHHTAGFNPPDQWDEYFTQIFDDPWYRGDRLNYPFVKPAPAPPGHPLNGLHGKANIEFDWGALRKPESEFGDSQLADWATGFLGRRHDRPFFLGVGFFHPHLPWYVPRKYLDMYPLKDIRRPEVREDDLSDIPPEGQKLAAERRVDFEAVVKSGQWEIAIRAYLASITFADVQVGRVLDALEKSPYARNTVVVLWSDNGWHLGEKRHWHKFTLWEAATRIPLIVAAPGVSAAGRECSRPASPIDLYPTLVELCGLKRKPELDGQSLVRFLKNPGAASERPALITANRGQHAVRSERWRYIRYSDGSEELYDHEHDPHEWTNLAGRSDPQLETVKKEHSRWLPAADAEPQPAKSAYSFDPANYTWRRVR